MSVLSIALAVLASRPSAPDLSPTDLWATFLKTTIREARSWPVKRAEVFLPSIGSGREIRTEAEVLLAPDRKVAYTFDGVRVRVARVLTSRAVALRGGPFSPSAHGPGAKAVFTALGREVEAQSCSTTEQITLADAQVDTSDMVEFHAWHRLDSALVAFLRRDDVRARDELAALHRDRSQLELRLYEIARRLDAHPMPGLGFLKNVPAWLTDVDRRVRQPQRRLDDRAARKSTIAQLIAGLSEEGMSMGGEEYLPLYGSSPVELVNRNLKAIPALLDACENDQRLTRGVGYWREYVPDRGILPVRYVADRILGSIAHLGEFPGQDNKVPGSRLRAAKRFFDQYRAPSMSRMALNLLRRPVDGSETDIALDHAAVNILVGAPNRFPGDMGNWMGDTADLFGKNKGRRFDDLTKAERDELVVLLDRRADHYRDQSNEHGVVPEISIAFLRTALRLAVVRAAILPDGALTRLRDLTSRILARDESAAGDSIAASFLLRARLGDRESYGEYFAWLQIQRAEDIIGPDLAPLIPLRDAARDHGYDAIVRWVLHGSKSPWPAAAKKSGFSWVANFEGQDEYFGPPPFFLKMFSKGTADKRYGEFSNVAFRSEPLSCTSDPSCSSVYPF